MAYPAVRAVISGVLGLDNRTKQELGRRIAYRLGLTPGPRGPDDGVDGSLEFAGRRFHFQCKLSRTPLDRDEARRYYSDIVFHEVDVSIMLAGAGFKDTFGRRLFGHSDLGVEVHLLTLRDFLLETPGFLAAVRDLPSLDGLGDVNWTAFA